MAPVRVQAFCSGMHFKHSWTAKVTRRWVGRSRWDASKNVDVFFLSVSAISTYANDIEEQKVQLVKKTHPRINKV